VLRLIALLIACALMFNNGTTVALAMCQHGDSQSHASARSSGDDQLSSVAMAEEAAERSITHSKAFSDGSPASFVAFVLASDDVNLLVPQSGSPLAMRTDERLPPGGSVAPLLRPPLS
jgi:hypothetical protein